MRSTSSSSSSDPVATYKAGLPTDLNKLTAAERRGLIIAMSEFQVLLETFTENKLQATLKRKREADRDDKSPTGEKAQRTSEGVDITARIAYMWREGRDNAINKDVYDKYEARHHAGRLGPRAVTRTQTKSLSRKRITMGSGISVSTSELSLTTTLPNSEKNKEAISVMESGDIESGDVSLFGEMIPGDQVNYYMK